MEKQKICIIGGGLTGLTTAIVLSKLNIKIDLISANSNNTHIKSNRTTAISQSNYNFLKNLKILESSRNEFWPCSHMKLYSKNEKEKLIEIFEMNKVRKKKEQIFYMFNNELFIKNLIKKIKKNKLITFKTEKKVSKIMNIGILKSVKFYKENSHKYNLIIVCTGNNSELLKNTFSNESFHHTYDDVSITTLLKHNSCNNNIARQIFLDDGILALLPISNTKTSIVFSINKKFINKYKKNKENYLRNKVHFYTKDFLKKIEFNSKIEFNNLNFLIRKKYFEDRVLLFGDALHQVHPLAGQGFNMILRDLAYLKKLLSEKTSLGLDIGNSDTLSEFSNVTQPRNFAYSIGIDFIKNSFSFENYVLKNFRNKIISDLNKNHFAKNIFYNIADKGLEF